MNRFRIQTWIAGCALAGAATTSASAAPLTPEQALGRLNGIEAGRRVISAGDRLRLVHTEEADQAQSPAFYVFDKPYGGYVIVSADDRLATVLADVDEGSFDINSLPDNTRWWLGEYVREIDRFLTHTTFTKSEDTSSRGVSKVRLKDTRQEISPMIKTQWSQTYPYNLKCPLTNGAYSATGCVATATAQVVNYHRWPETHGFGTHTYTMQDGRSFTYDFEKTVFNWDDMLDTYANGSTTQAQKDAVAVLMEACGMAVNMEYGNYESAAQSFFIPWGLQEYMGYASSTSFASRDTYSLWEWEELIYQELLGGRPVNYGGSGGGGGHQFVADGYRSDNLFHINWGWSGKSDGYFRLTALDPQSLGTGGGTGGYNYRQTAIVGCCPPDKAEGLEPVSPLYITSQMVVENVSPGSTATIFKIAFQGGGVFANVSSSYSGQFGVIVTDDNDNYLEASGYSNLTFQPATFQGTNGFSSAYAQVPTLQPGAYRLYPAFKKKGTNRWERIPIYNGNSRYINLTVDENRKLTFESSALKTLPELEVAELTVPDEIELAAETIFQVEVYNGDAVYDGDVRLYLCGVNKDEADTLIASQYLTMKANSNAVIEMPVIVKSDAGERRVFFADCLGRRISSDFTIKVIDTGLGVNGINETPDGNIRVFDLQGRELQGLPSEPGIYLVRNGNKTRKIAI